MRTSRNTIYDHNGTIRVKKRDSHSLELKLKYLLDREPTKRAAERSVAVYFFLPSSFNIRKETYDRSRFYRSLKLYLRFNTPYFTANELLSRKSTSSPLARLETMVAGAAEGTGSLSVDDFIHESKLLGCIYKSLSRDMVQRIRVSLTDEEKDRQVERKAYKTVRSLYAVARRYHALRSMLDRLPDSAQVMNHYCLIDEHLSLTLEKYLTSLLVHARSLQRAKVADRVYRVVSREGQYRKKMGYPSVLEHEDDHAQHEEYVSREKMLKRYASDVLFFDIRSLNTRKGTEHILSAVAAGFAMVFATAVLFYGRTRFGDFSLSLFVLLVVSYMLKDRIKELFKILFSRTLGTFLADRTTWLYDPQTHRKMAGVAERCAFVKAGTLGGRIRSLRNESRFRETVTAGEREQILQYTRRIALRVGTWKKMHRRIMGLADISIVDLRDFVRLLASRRTVVPVFGDDGRVEMVSVRRTYRLNMVLHYREADRECLTRIRLIVDSNGIKRLETVASDDPGSVR